MWRLTIILLFATGLSSCSAVPASNPPPSSPLASGEAVVHAFIKAFNERKLDTMLDQVSEDVEWLSIDGKELSVVTGDKAALGSALTDYFEQCSTCRSYVENMMVNHSRVSVTETTSWESEGVTRSQSALSIYELDGNIIKRVYYFPTD